MRQILKILLISSLSLVCILAFQNCSKVAFVSDIAATNAANGVAVDGTGSPTGNDSTCHVDLVNTTKPVKVLFLIDTSGSNQSNSGLEGTDPGKTWRLATINSFINDYGSKSNFEFGFATFQETSAKSLITENNHGIFTNNMTDINQAIADFKNTPDAGYTPYDAALAIVKDMISYDQSKQASKDVAYIVVMISDGTPTNSTYTDPKNGLNNLTVDVNSVINTAPTQISLNTVFLYNKNVPTASDKTYLQKIASLGSGSFIEASSQQTLQISDSVQVPKKTCQ